MSIALEQKVRELEERIKALEQAISERPIPAKQLQEVPNGTLTLKRK